MTWTDITIIYLACGAPFAVYFFLHRTDSGNLAFRPILLSILSCIFWLPLSIYFLVKVNLLVRFDKLSSPKETRANKEELQKLIKQFEKIFFSANPHDSIFEFREILERYAGLSLLMQKDSKRIADGEKEIFKISGKSKNELSTICLNRRNRRRLFFHQKNAREDFLQSFDILYSSISDTKTLENTALKFVKALNDSAARAEIEKTIAENLQTEKDLPVKHLEKDLWKPELQKQPLRPRISIPLQTLKAKPNSSAKD